MVFFEGLVAERATVRITTTQGTRAVEFREMAYTDVYPNGRECTPRCSQASVAVELPT